MLNNTDHISVVELGKGSIADLDINGIAPESGVASLCMNQNNTLIYTIMLDSRILEWDFLNDKHHWITTGAREDDDGQGCH